MITASGIHRIPIYVNLTPKEYEKFLDKYNEVYGPEDECGAICSMEFIRSKVPKPYDLTISEPGLKLKSLMRWLLKL